MFNLKESIIDKIFDKITPRKLVPAGVAVAFSCDGCRGCTGSCDNSCQGSCSDTCSYGCGRSTNDD